MWYYNTEHLCHHGIKNQKWGIRRWQNRDGSLTSEGRIHYGYNSVKQDFEEKKALNIDKINRTKQLAKDITDKANEVGKEYEKAFSNVKLNEKDRNDIMKKLEDEYGLRCNNKEYFNMSVEEYVNEKIYEKVNSMIDKNIASDFEKTQEEYWANVKEFSNDLLSKYGNSTIHSIPNSSTYKNNGKQVVDDLIDSEFDTSLNSYIYRHFDDYWINDTDAHYNAVNKAVKDLNITMDEYNRKHS